MKTETEPVNVGREWSGPAGLHCLVIRRALAKTGPSYVAPAPARVELFAVEKVHPA